MLGLREDRASDSFQSVPSETTLLGQKELYVLEIMQYCSISCLEGAAWITYPGRFCDYIIKAGESLSLRGTGKIVISGGCGSCTIQVSGW